MSENSEEFDPMSPENLLRLLPEACQGCAAAEFAVFAVMAFGGAAGSPLNIIRDIQDRCTGYKGIAPQSGETIGLLDTPMGPAIMSEDPFDENCPLFGADEDSYPE